MAMTPKELAEKILQSVDIVYSDNTRAKIEFLITAALDDLTRKECNQLHLDEDAKRIQEAYEGCAKIAETPLPEGSILPIRGAPNDVGAIVEAVKVLSAKQIRQAAKELSK